VGGERKLRPYPPEKLAEALKEARDPNRVVSLPAIAAKHRVNYFTLAAYVRTGRVDIPRLGRPPILDRADEERFVEWLSDRHLACAPIPPDMAAEKVQQLVQRRNKQRGTSREFSTPTGQPSQTWWREFQRRHPQLRRGKPSRHSAATLRAITDPTKYTTFFQKVEPTMSKIRKGRRFCVDEMSLVPHNKSQTTVWMVTGTARCRALEAQGRSANTTLVNTVCDDGSWLPTGVILGGRNEDVRLTEHSDNIVSLGYTSKCSGLHARLDSLVQSLAGKTPIPGSCTCAGCET
jgi:hypothetical protein